MAVEEETLKDLATSSGHVTTVLLQGGDTVIFLSYRILPYLSIRTASEEHGSIEVEVFRLHLGQSHYLGK